MTVKENYKKEYNRVRNLLNRMESQGYLGVKELLPPPVKSPTKASVARLQKYTKESVANRTQYFVDYETGEFVSGKWAYISQKAHKDPFKPLALQRTAKQIQKAAEREKKQREREEKKQQKAAERKAKAEERRQQRKAEADKKKAEAKEKKDKRKPEPDVSRETPPAPVDLGLDYPVQPDTGSTEQPQQPEEPETDKPTSPTPTPTDDIMPWAEPLVDALIEDVKAMLTAEIKSWRGKTMNEFYRGSALQVVDRYVAQDMEKVAKNIKQNSLELNQLIDTIMYDSDDEKVAFAYDKFVDIIRGGF